MTDEQYEQLKRIDVEINLLDEQYKTVSNDLERIYSILVDLEELHSKLRRTSLYDIISRDFLVIKSLCYKERDKLNKESDRIIKRRGRLGVKRAKVLGHSF